MFSAFYPNYFTRSTNSEVEQMGHGEEHDVLQGGPAGEHDWGHHPPGGS
jgi:hypothetical protein